MNSAEQSAWLLDQISKSVFFHQKLHAWEMVAIVARLDDAPASNWDWSLTALNIEKQAWNKVVHHPKVTPVRVFAHPRALQTISGALRYYRMLAMVSQKSMQRLGLPVSSLEARGTVVSEERAQQLAKHLNKIISSLILQDKILQPEELWLWRGMAAGAQAQGSWQNAKGDRIEQVVRERLEHYLRSLGTKTTKQGWQAEKIRVIFSSEPDIAVYRGQEIIAAAEIKGGIDAAGVLERIGAAVKSLQRVKDAFPAAATVLVLTSSSMTPQAREDLSRQRSSVNKWYLLEDLLQNEAAWQEFLEFLRLSR